jgi:hypothetical protein
MATPDIVYELLSIHEFLFQILIERGRLTAGDRRDVEATVRKIRATRLDGQSRRDRKPATRRD